MRIAIHPEAEEELSAAALWYEGQQAGLGDDFVNEFESTLHRILRVPVQWRVFQGENRKLNFHRFPYAIVYSLHGETLFLKAVMHLSRRPFYWRDRQPPAL